MSGLSSNAAVWSTLLEPVDPPAGIPDRPDDARLNRFTTFWPGKQPVKLRADPYAGDGNESIKDGTFAKSSFAQISATGTIVNDDPAK